MRIIDIEKRRAIKRLPEFKKDYTIYKQLKAEDKITQFRINFNEKWGYELDAIRNADDVVKHRRDTPTVEAVQRITDAPYAYTYTGEEKTPSRLFGDCLYLKVTLEGKTEAQLVKDFKEAIKAYRKLLEPSPSKERNRKTDIREGIWAVYDLYLMCHKNMNETTRQWFNVSGNPAPLPNDNEFDEKLRKQIKTAVSNAEAIITSVREEYGLK